MKEDFLHYLWRFKKFNLDALLTTRGEAVTVLSVGQYLQSSGPDFFNAQIIIGDQKWAGTVEIHLKSSDWYLHNHQYDIAYENVILHVVWEHDTDVFRGDNSTIPVLQIKEYVALGLVENYSKLLQPKNWIYCESDIHIVDKAIVDNWKDRLFLERLQRKSEPIFELQSELNSDWEAILFYLLAKNFGLNTNGDSFFSIARTISFAVFRKEVGNIANLEALLLGFSGLLNADFEEVYPQDLKILFSFLLTKHKLPEVSFAVEFFKHRPDNFPTIRLSQLALLYFQNRDLFARIMAVDSVKGLYELFAISSSEYWDTHYQLDRVSPTKKKKLSKSFIDLLIINTIIPIRFAYAKSRGGDEHQKLFDLLHDISPETNVVIAKFREIGIQCDNAIDSQALLQLKNEYCNKGMCLQCVIGFELLKSTTEVT